MATAIGSVGTVSVASNLLATSFSLSDLSAHNFPIEHDASLSRADYNLANGDATSFNQSIFDTVLAYWPANGNATIATAGQARYNRVLTEQARNSGFVYGPEQLVLSYGEMSLLLSVMGDPVTGVAPVKYIKQFVRKS